MGVYEILELPELSRVSAITIRLIAAAVLGGLVGGERESVGKSAGLRTHMLVSLGAALFVLGPSEVGMGEGDLGRIIQGVATGIGFVGAGTILKRSDRDEIHGLTTAAGIWLTAAVGVSAAVSPLWVPAVSAVFALVILKVLRAIEGHLGSD